MFHECLVGRPYPRATRKTQLSPSCLDSSHSSHVQSTCIISRDAQSRATYENSSVFNLLESSLSLSHTQLLQLNPTINTGYKRLNKITIKFGTELKPTKQIVVNYNFTILMYVLSPIFTYVVFFLSLYTCFFLLVCNLLFLFHTKMP